MAGGLCFIHWEGFAVVVLSSTIDFKTGRVAFQRERDREIEKRVVTVTGLELYYIPTSKPGERRANLQLHEIPSLR